MTCVVLNHASLLRVLPSILSVWWLLEARFAADKYSAKKKHAGSKIAENLFQCPSIE